MHLYLVQHAEAMNEEEDPSRSLSERGIDDIRKIGRFASGLNIEVRQIVHSGKMRALQTAQVLADHITSDMGVLESDGLAPKDEPQIWRDRIVKLKESIMVVGHLPHLGRLASLLLVRQEMDLVSFEMGCIVCMGRREGNGWSLDWMIKPRIIT